MTNVALVVFKDANKAKLLNKNKLFKSHVLKTVEGIKELLYKSGFFKTRFGTRFYFYSKRKELNSPTKTIEISGELCLRIIKLPVSQGRLSYINNNIMEKTVKKILVKITADSCFAPSSIIDKGYLNAFKKCPCNDKQLLKFMFSKVFTDLYQQSAKRIGDLDIVIIAGDNITDALVLVRLIEEQIRYVTIAVTEKESAELEAEKIFGDMGLSISIVSDCRGALKNADIIINLADRYSIPPKLKISKAVIIFNLENDDISRSFPENLIVNGLVSELSKNDAVSLDKEILKYYSRKEISEFVIAFLVKLEQDTIFDYENCKRIQNDFVKYGFRAMGAAGRHGVIKMDVLQKLVEGSS